MLIWFHEQTIQTFFLQGCHKSPEYLGQKPALSDKKPSGFPDWQSPPEGEKKTPKKRWQTTMQLAKQITSNPRKHLILWKASCWVKIKFGSIDLDFAASYLPPLGVFHSSLSIFNVVVQDKGHSFHSVQDNLWKGQIKGKLSPAGLKKAKKKTMVFYLGWGWGGVNRPTLTTWP